MVTDDELIDEARVLISNVFVEEGTNKATVSPGWMGLALVWTDKLKERGDGKETGDTFLTINIYDGNPNTNPFMSRPPGVILGEDAKIEPLSSVSGNGEQLLLGAVGVMIHDALERGDLPDYLRRDFKDWQRRYDAVFRKIVTR